MKLKGNRQLPETGILLVMSVVVWPPLCQFQDSSHSVHRVNSSHQTGQGERGGNKADQKQTLFLSSSKQRHLKETEVQGCPHTTSKTNKIQKHDVLSMACPEQYRREFFIQIVITSHSFSHLLSSFFDVLCWSRPQVQYWVGWKFAIIYCGHSYTKLTEWKQFSSG